MKNKYEVQGVSTYTYKICADTGAKQRCPFLNKRLELSGAAYVELWYCDKISSPPLETDPIRHRPMRHPACPFGSRQAASSTPPLRRSKCTDTALKAAKSPHRREPVIHCRRDVFLFVLIFSQKFSHYFEPCPIQKYSH